MTSTCKNVWNFCICQKLLFSFGLVIFNTGKTRINYVNTEMGTKRGVDEKFLFSGMLVYYLRVFLLQINVKVFESLTYKKYSFIFKVNGIHVQVYITIDSYASNLQL